MSAKMRRRTALPSGLTSSAWMCFDERVFAQWIVGLRYFPPAVVDRAKGVTLHSLAVPLNFLSFAQRDEGFVHRELSGGETNTCFCLAFRP